MTFIEVAVAAPIFNTLTYIFAPQKDENLLPGTRVLVPLGRRLVTGYCLDTAANAPPELKLKKINKILDLQPIFPADMIDFFRWAADYYQHPIGEVIKAAIPGGLTPQYYKKTSLTAAGKIFFQTLCSKEDHPICKLLQTGSLTPSESRSLWRQKTSRMQKWQEEHLLIATDAVTGDTVREKKEVCIRPSQKLDLSEVTESLKKSEKKTLDLLTAHLSASNQEWIARKDITRQYSGARAAILSLHEKGLLDLQEIQIYRDPFGDQTPYYPTPEKLSDEQEVVLEKIYPAIAKAEFKTFLLHGITGSGKTEIYLRAAESTLALGKSVMILVPEIALATQLEGHFVSRFADNVALLHSGLSSGEKFDQWQRLLKGEVKIVIGARSAVFAPMTNIGLIIVDEEHDGAYKQDDGFKYNGRDLAVLRAKQERSVIILGSATPSIVSYSHTETGKYTLLEMKNRIADRPLPEVEVVDLRAVKTTTGTPPLFSPQFVKAIRQNFRDGNQTLVFLNRRGYANLVFCRDCGETIKCKDCSITLTLHSQKRQLVCHHCGYSVNSAIICPSCRSNGIINLGFGTERIEEEIRKLLPDASIARLDQDTATNRKDYIAILKGVHLGKTNLLIGTQMIAKGHHFPNVTLVAVVWADAGLGLPDFRSGERTFQILTQVFGRAGRGEKSGRVLVQTYNPEHYSISTSKVHDFHELYQKEIGLRKRHSFPPFCRLINIQIEGKKEADVKKAATFLADIVKKFSPPSVSILGPAPAPLSFLKGVFRWQLLLKGNNFVALQAVCQKMLKTKFPQIPQNAVKLSVDVDPENML